jgi:Family of unknown function (DUF6492)
MQHLPIVTISCTRDLALLELQAQSINKYLAEKSKIYIIVNEYDSREWYSYFTTNLKHYYDRHNLTLLYRTDFDAPWSEWIPSAKNPWAGGWDMQQILKLAVAEKIEAPGYLVLDSQNFLIKPFDPVSQLDDRLPYRAGKFVMPTTTWDEYACQLELSIGKPTDNTLSICTPIFLHTELVRSLIKWKNNLAGFTQWFKSVRGKSEFILYLLWAEKNGGLEKYHYKSSFEWGGPYLRDSLTFSEDFKKSFPSIGLHPWVSANHRSWGIMSNEEYQQLSSKLSIYGLKTNFDQYRKDYLEKYK